MPSTISRVSFITFWYLAIVAFTIPVALIGCDVKDGLSTSRPGEAVTLPQTMIDSTVTHRLTDDELKALHQYVLYVGTSSENFYSSLPGADQGPELTNVCYIRINDEPIFGYKKGVIQVDLLPYLRAGTNHVTVTGMATGAVYAKLAEQFGGKSTLIGRGVFTAKGAENAIAFEADVPNFWPTMDLIRPDARSKEIYGREIEKVVGWIYERYRINHSVDVADYLMSGSVKSFELSGLSFFDRASLLSFADSVKKSNVQVPPTPKNVEIVYGKYTAYVSNPDGWEIMVSGS